MVAVAVFLERGHLNAPHTSSLSQDSLLKAFLTQTQQHRTLPQWQPCLLPLKLHPVTRRSWTKHISLPPLAVSKVQDYRQHAGALLEKFFAVWEGCVREFGGWQPSCSSLLEETHVEFGYVGTFEHAVTYKWHILYAWWTQLKYLVNWNVTHQCVTCFRFQKRQSDRNMASLLLVQLSVLIAIYYQKYNFFSSLNESLGRYRVCMAAHRWHCSVPQWPKLARHIDRVPLPEPYFIHPWNN